MANERFCMGCMQPISEFSDNCYHCGYPVTGQNPAGYLPVRTRLGERYVVGRALEKRGDAIVYIGYDKTEKNTVLIREFFPEGLAQRLSLQVVAIEGKEAAFDGCYEQFRKQSRTIARLREVPAMIPIYDMFEANGTMYTVADHVEGVPFRRYLETLGGHMQWSAARPLFVPLLSSLISVHAAGLYHLGISPDSILVDSDNRLRLDGWQIADVRMTGGELPTAQPAGYAAPEQYNEGGAASQEADVYAIGATMLYALTGEEPPAAPDRVSKVASLTVPANVAEKWPAHIAPSLCDALMLNPRRRIPTMEQLRDRLTTAPVVEALREDALEEEIEALPVDKKDAKKTAIIALSAVCAVLAAVVIWLLATGNRAPKDPVTDIPTGNSVATTTTTGSTKETEATKPNSNQYEVENLVGLSLDEVYSRQLRGNMSVHIKGKEFSDSIPEGMIVSQYPLPETYADVNTVIEVFISDGPAEKDMINLLGWERDAAVTYLEAMGYRVSVIEVTVSDYPRGRVDGMSPAPGTPTAEGEEVVLQISAVPETTRPTSAPTNFIPYN